MANNDISPRDLKMAAIDVLGVQALIGSSLTFDHQEDEELLYVCPDTGKPKLSVSRRTGQWQSFTAGTEGDLIDLLMKANNWSFQDTLHELAGAAGISLNGDAPSESAYFVQKRRLGVLSEAVRFMVAALHRTQAGTPVLEYLHGRKYTTAQIERMGLGWYGNGDWLEGQLVKRGYTHEEIRESGLRDPSSLGTASYALAIPWRDRHGQVVGIAVRDITGTRDVKYYYNKGFNRGKYLLGLEHYKGGNLTLVEGSMDSPLLNAEDITCAAIGQDKLSNDQLQQIIAAKVEVVTLGLDGDSSGRGGTLRAIGMLRKANIPVVVTDWGKAKDPDELYRLEGIGAVREAIASPVSCGAWLATEDMLEFNPDDIRSREVILTKCHRRYISLLQTDPMGASDYIQTAAHNTSLPPTAVSARIRGAADTLNRGIVLAGSVRMMSATVGGVLDNVMERLKSGAAAEERFETGFDWLNEQMRWFQPSDTIVEQAGFGTGKSKFSLWQSCQQVLSGTKVGYVSIDMEEVGLSDYAGVVMHNSTCNPQQMIKWKDLMLGDGGVAHLSKIRDVKLAIERHFGGKFYECTVPRLNLVELQEIEREMVRQGCQVIYLDQLELLDEYQKATSTRNYDAITAIMATQKEFANEFKFAKIIQHQVTREGMRRGNPGARDSAGSDAVGRQAKFLLSFFDPQVWYCEEGERGFDVDQKTGLPRSPRKNVAPQFTEPQLVRPIQIKLSKTRRGNRGQSSFWFDFAHGVVVPPPERETHFMSAGNPVEVETWQDR